MNKPEFYCAEDERDWLRQQLAASQAREAQLRDTISTAYKMTTDTYKEGEFDWAVFCEMLYQALALPQDTTALEAMIAKTGEVMRERAANTTKRPVGWLHEITQRYASEVSNAIRTLPGVTLADLEGGAA